MELEQPAAESEDVVFNGLNVKGFEELLEADDSDGDEDETTAKEKLKALRAKGKEQMAAIHALRKPAAKGPLGVKKSGGK